MLTKSVKVKQEDVEVVEIHCVELSCPYCKERLYVERSYEPPKKHKCEVCNRKFNIKYENE